MASHTINVGTGSPQATVTYSDPTFKQLHLRDDELIKAIVTAVTNITGVNNGDKLINHADCHGICIELSHHLRAKYDKEPPKPIGAPY